MPVEKPKIDFITTVQMMKEAALFGAAEFGDALFGGRPQLGTYTEATAREYFVYRATTEIQKAGLAMSRWADFAATIGGAAKDIPKNPVENLRLASFIDEQGLWRRKLVEMLVQLICFSDTNRAPYFYHYLLIADLCRCLFDRQDQRTYFNSESAIIGADAKILLDKIAEVERNGQLDIRQCWYLAESKPLGRVQPSQIRPQNISTTIAKQLQRALSKAVETEKFALGYSYRIAVSDPSDDIHFSATASDSKSGEDRFRLGCILVGFLAAAILSRCHSLTGVSPQGVASDFVRLCVQRPMSQISLFFGVAEAGDFVVVAASSGPFLAQVEEILTIELGYRRYRVRFLDEKPFGKIEEDWVLPNRITLHQRRAELIAATETQLRASAPDDLERLASLLAIDNLHEAIRMAVVEAWKLAFRGMYQEAFDKQRNA